VENLDWTKIKQALLSHEWIALAVLVWLLSVVLYCILQVWLTYSWTGRWRVTALIPLIGLAALIAIFFIGQSYDPGVFGPPGESPLDNFILGVLFFAPIGFIYFVIVGIMHRSRRKLTAT
jgi:hypothetical protein